MAIRHPFQKLCCVHATTQHEPLLFAASGPNIFTFQLQSGKATSRWSALEGPKSLLTKTIPNPSKRRKLDDEQDGTLSRQESEEPIEISVERRKGERRKPKIEQPKSSNVSHVLAAADGQTLVAVTADDKTIHVFGIIGKNGVLLPKSSRSMPKRICAVVLDPSETNIVVGDKFGDVYSLPLHPSDAFIQRKSATETFEPSATELTVHTKGNLEALRQQRERKTINPRKEGPDFEHKLLLGHVSLLTDVLIAKVHVEGRNRSFILTSDRDEHIRVSRYPQAHIIEGYCLGHRQFVSKLCIPGWAPQYLISGSGEPSVRIFDWREGRVVDQELFDKDAQFAVQKALELSKGERSFDKLAVSGIWTVSMNSIGEGMAGGEPGRVLVALEGLPLLLSLTLNLGGKLSYHQTIAISGNVLDVAQAQGQNLIIVSLDPAHKVGSMKAFDMGESLLNETMVAFQLGTQFDKLEWVPASIAEPLNAAITELENMSEVLETERSEQQRSKGDYSSLGEFLYGLENLRKRRGQAMDDAEDEVDDDEPIENR